VAGTRGLRLFFASDIHGSERCWKKFLAAGEVHDADVLIMGGDVTAKAIVPIFANGSGYYATVGSKTERLETRDDLSRFVGGLHDMGFYTHVLQSDEADMLDEETGRDALYKQLASETMQRWLAIADERLKGTGRRCLFLPGNDDIWEIDDELSGSQVIENPDGRVLRLEAGHELIGCAYSNPTPWNTPRELPEEGLHDLLEGLVSKVDDLKGLILVAHVPPYDSVIDHCPRVVLEGEEVVVKRRFGQPDLVPAGSTAVRAFIEEYQPVVSLHGHIHEAKGIVEIGRTYCVNPGSEFTSGDISGAIVELRDGGIVQCQLVTG
jgi:Icc-related predicted phosphoesterase